MAVDKYQKIITPFLMGQRRDGILRLQSLFSDNWHIVDVPEFKEVELKDIDTKIERMGKIYLALSEQIKISIENDFIPISFAGDCVSTLGVLAGLQKAGKTPDQLLWLDAHGDFHTWETSQTKYIGGMPLAMLVGRGDQRIVNIVGLKPYPENKIILSDARDLDFGEKETLESSKVVKCNIKDILKYISQEESVYLHFDTDIVNAEEEMPALKYHVKSGPTYSEVEDLFKSLRNINIIAISISAWHDEKDLNNKTAKACLSLLKNLMD
jgi:arginase